MTPLFAEPTVAGSLFVELTTTARTRPEPGEPAGAFARRLAEAVDATCEADEVKHGDPAGDGAIWKSLSEPARAWVNRTLMAIDKGDPVGAVPGFIAVPPTPAARPVELELNGKRAAKKALKQAAAPVVPDAYVCIPSAWLDVLDALPGVNAHRLMLRLLRAASEQKTETVVVSHGLGGTSRGSRLASLRQLEQAGLIVLEVGGP